MNQVYFMNNYFLLISLVFNDLGNEGFIDALLRKYDSISLDTLVSHDLEKLVSSTRSTKFQLLVEIQRAPIFYIQWFAPWNPSPMYHSLEISIDNMPLLSQHLLELQYSIGSFSIVVALCRSFGLATLAFLIETYSIL